MVIILCYIHCNEFTSHLPAMHVNFLCACWYSWAVKGSSSLSFCRLPISLWFTSYLFLCPKLTDAPYSGYGAPPPFLFQNGVFIHRVRTLSLSRAQHNHFAIPLKNVKAQIYIQEASDSFKNHQSQSPTFALSIYISYSPSQSRGTVPFSYPIDTFIYTSSFIALTV